MYNVVLLPLMLSKWLKVEAITILNKHNYICIKNYYQLYFIVY